MTDGSDCDFPDTTTHVDGQRLVETHAAHHGERVGDDRPAANLVGREAEVDRLQAFLADARTSGGALLVTGEPGIGKTAVLHAASAAASEAGTRVLHAAGIEFETLMSFSGLNQVLLPLLDTLPTIPTVHRDALNVALGFGEGSPPSRLVVSNAALVLLRTAAADRPLLVVVDDLPWLDRASAGVLGFVARRLEGSHVAFIGASRTGEQDSFDHAGLTELVIRALDEVAAGELLDARFPDLSTSVRGRILIEAEGNPLGLVELPAALTPRMRTSTNALPSTLPLGPRLPALFRAKITTLPEQTRRLLLRMALDGTGDVRVLDAASGPNISLGDLAPAEQARLAFFDQATHRLAFRHPLIRTTVVDVSTAEERRAAHRQLSDLWAEQPERHAWHLAEATLEPEESVAALLEAAAARILARGDAIGCVNALTRASELSPDTADRNRRLAAAAFIGADVTGDLTNAHHVLAELRRGATNIEGSLMAAAAASIFLLQGDGDVRTAHRLLVDTIHSNDGARDARDPVTAEALYSLMMVCSYGGDEELWRPFDEAIAATEGIPLALALASRSFADPARVGQETIAELDAAIAALTDETDPTQIIRIAIAANYVDRVHACRPALWRIVRDGRAGGAVGSMIIALLAIAYDDTFSGRWDEAEELLEEGIERCEALGYRIQAWPGRYLQAVIAAARGDTERTQQLTEALVQWGGPRGIRVGLWHAWHALALAAVARGDFEEAYRLASRISPPGQLAPHVPVALYVLMDFVEAAVHTGRDAEAAAHVAAMQEANLSAVSPRLALAVGACAAMAAPDDRGLALFEAALALPGIERWQFDFARLRLAYGERLRRRRAMTDARTQLDAALVIFERLGAEPWVERTNAELRATGQTKPRAGESVLDRLTPQEFEIVSLAASGLTNKQIAERLFLSHRTVGGHLHRAFPKLGVSTRAALRDAIASLPTNQLPRG